MLEKSPRAAKLHGVLPTLMDRFDLAKPLGWTGGRLYVQSKVTASGPNGEQRLSSQKLVLEVLKARLLIGFFGPLVLVVDVSLFKQPSFSVFVVLSSWRYVFLKFSFKRPKGSSSRPKKTKETDKS